MPWCDTCEHYYNPNSVHDDGTCPKCGSALAKPAQIRRARNGRGSSADARLVRSERSATAAGDEVTDDDRVSAPWHFWVLLVALVIYLGYRLLQGIIWVSGRL